jgi:hypothetical protein
MAPKAVNGCFEAGFTDYAREVANTITHVCLEWLTKVSIDCVSDKA